MDQTDGRTDGLTDDRFSSWMDGALPRYNVMYRHAQSEGTPRHTSHGQALAATGKPMARAPGTRPWKDHGDEPHSLLHSLHGRCRGHRKSHGENTRHAVSERGTVQALPKAAARNLSAKAS